MNEELYIELCKPEYNQGYISGSYTKSLGDDMSIVHQSLLGWWKPRFLMDHRSREAYEFIDCDLCFADFSEDNIDWDSLKGIPDEILKRVRRGYAGFPTSIGHFEGGVAEVAWQINPDGRYYMDDDGYGMTEDVEITLYGTIDRRGKVVRKYHLKERAL